MMNRKTKILYSLLPTLCSLLMVACTTDSYESGDSELSYLFTEMCDVRVKGVEVVSITNDKGAAVAFYDGMSMTKEFEHPDTVYRMMIYYTGAKDNIEDVHKTDMVAVVAPVELEKTPTVKTDPVSLTALWKLDSGKYLNMMIDVMSGKADDKHLLAVTTDSICDVAGTRCHYLTLRHDRRAMPEYYTRTLYMSIPMDCFHAGDSINITTVSKQGKRSYGFKK